MAAYMKYIHASAHRSGYAEEFFFFMCCFFLSSTICILMLLTDLEAKNKGLTGNRNSS